MTSMRECVVWARNMGIERMEADASSAQPKEDHFRGDGTLTRIPLLGLRHRGCLVRGHSVPAERLVRERTGYRLPKHFASMTWTT